VFGEKGPTQDTIEQGELQDCYFVTAMCCLATKPELLSEIFVTRTANQEGKYTLWLYINGNRQLIEVDDYLPWNLETESLAFAHSKNKGEIWMSILEKAWAKVSGSYCKIIDGQQEAAFAWLTNKPSQ